VDVKDVGCCGLDPIEAAQVSAVILFEHRNEPFLHVVLSVTAIIRQLRRTMGNQVGWLITIRLSGHSNWKM